jgi:hypothetical protein
MNAHLDAAMQKAIQANKAKKEGFVREKMRKYSAKHPKKREPDARAGASGGAGRAGEKAVVVVKIPKVIRTLLDSMNEDDLDQVARVYREAMNATTTMWDVNERKLITLPDHKTRIAAANMVAAYKEGLPVQRQIRLGAHFDELRDVVERAKRSPAMLDFAKRLLAGQVQKSGAEKMVENARVIPAESEVQKSTSPPTPPIARSQLAYGLAAGQQWANPSSARP